MVATLVGMAFMGVGPTEASHRLLDSLPRTPTCMVIESLQIARHEPATKNASRVKSV